jgi:beta-1,4-N-acetylglucosaminyltransferase
VGTTKFDALVEALDSPDLTDLLVTKGYSKLIIQKGAGSYIPQHILRKGEASNQLPNGLEVQCFDFSPSLAEYMSEAALVISHAGSGSIFETLQAGGERARARITLCFRELAEQG